MRRGSFHSDSAAERLALKVPRLMRWRSWLKWLWKEAWGRDCLAGVRSVSLCDHIAFVFVDPDVEALS